MTTFTAIAWRKRTFGVDGLLADRTPWDVRRVLVEPCSPNRALVIELATGESLKDWGDKGRDWEDIHAFLAAKPKTPIMDMVTVEGNPPFQSRVSWKVIPEKDLPGHLAQLETQRETLQKDRRWATLGEVAELIHILTRT